MPSGSPLLLYLTTCLQLHPTPSACSCCLRLPLYGGPIRGRLGPGGASAHNPHKADLFVVTC
ncbi:hypothetical protein PICMEDRAFT_16160 [Pichia membranifaciens NRRL Y-2026]|uniref:Secreted protein n=1 Tax=Pichia membranifaciens NRRL Y-2026 TaxID=763406 RepID=A0A1E3NJC5_9ASCO|nr:hypothetical protein PICMEDRAFT_16160 [Pichia membranifaciens NRRL Y-2026]ODQ46245.1 hypothetical protein PICMEDRAFT_16160 [Pichia membranifaciens NRRL Y-2026]